MSMPRDKVYLTCALCGAKVERALPNQRIWHQKCPKRGPRQAAPEYLAPTRTG